MVSYLFLEARKLLNRVLSGMGVRSSKVKMITGRAHHLPKFYYGTLELLLWSFVDLTAAVIIVVCEHCSSTTFRHTFFVSPLRLR